MDGQAGGHSLASCVLAEPRLLLLLWQSHSGPRPPCSQTLWHPRAARPGPEAPAHRCKPVFHRSSPHAPPSCTLSPSPRAAPSLLPSHSPPPAQTSSAEWCVCPVAQSCPAPCDPMDCSPPGSSVHGIRQARVLEWAAVSFSRGSSRPRDRTCTSYVPCIVGRCFTPSATWETSRGDGHCLLLEASSEASYPSPGTRWILPCPGPWHPWT